MNLQDTSSNYLWPGLAPYQENDRHLFYGRGAEIFDLTRKVLNSRLTILFGPSGAGKTSLLQAGVCPRLREEKLLPVKARIEFPLPGDMITPVTLQLEGDLKRDCEKEGLSIRFKEDAWFAGRKDNLSLWEWLRSFTLEDSGGSVWQPVFIFDQFEEVFTLGRHAGGMESFLRQIGDAAENFLPGELSRLIDEGNMELPFDSSEQPYKMVISLREDYLAQLQGLRQVLPGVTVRQNHFQLVRLTGSQALEAVRGPAPDGMISPRVALEIIRFVANASENPETGTLGSDSSLDRLEVEPAILSLVCQQLDARRLSQDRQTITVDFVKQSKGRILEEFYETAMERVQPETRHFIENRLLDAEGFRTSEPESNLVHRHIPQDDIMHLINLRLLHRIEHYQRSHLELSHDVLAPVVRASRDMRLQREEGQRLKAESAKRQMEISRLKKQRRRSIVLIGSFGIIALFALMAVFFGIRKQEQALRLEKESRIKYYLSESNRLLGNNKILAEAFTANAFIENGRKHNPGLMRNILNLLNDPLNNYRESNVFGDYGRFISPEGCGKLYGITNYGSFVEITDNGNPVNEILFNNEIILTAFFENCDAKRLLTAATAPPFRLILRTYSGEKIQEWDFEPANLQRRSEVGFSTPLQSSAKVTLSSSDGTRFFISNNGSCWYLNLNNSTFQELRRTIIANNALIEPKPFFYQGEPCFFYGDTIFFPDRAGWKNKPVLFKLDKAFIPVKKSDNRYFYSTSYNRESKRTNYYSLINDKPYLSSHFDKEIISDYLGEDYHFLLTAGNEILVLKPGGNTVILDTIRLIENFRKIIYADEGNLFLQAINGDIKVYNRIDGLVSSHIQNVHNFPTCSVIKITGQEYLLTFTNSFEDPYETVNEPVLITLQKNRIKIKSDTNVSGDYFYEVKPDSLKVYGRRDSSLVNQINTSGIYFDYSADSGVYLTVSVNRLDTAIYSIYNRNELIKTFRFRVEHIFTFAGENSCSFGTPPELDNNGKYFYTTSNPFILYKIPEDTSLTLSMTYQVSEWIRQTRHYRYFSGYQFEYLLTFSAKGSGSCFDLMTLPDTTVLMHRDYDQQLNQGFACTADYFFISHGDSVSGYNIHADKEEWSINLPRIIEIEFDTLNNILIANNGTDIFIIDLYGNVLLEKKQARSFSYFSKNKYFGRTQGKWCFINKDLMIDTLYLPDYYSKKLDKKIMWNLDFLKLSEKQPSTSDEVVSDWSDIVDKQKILLSFENGSDILIRELKNEPPPMFYIRTRQAFSYFGLTDDMDSFVKRFGFDLLRNNPGLFENYSMKSGICQLAEYGILNDRGHADKYFRLLYKYDNKRAEELINNVGFINDSIKAIFYQSAFNYYFIGKANFSMALDLYRMAKAAKVTIEGKYIAWRLLIAGDKAEALKRVKDEIADKPEDELNMANYLVILWVNGNRKEAEDFFRNQKNKLNILRTLSNPVILNIDRNKSAEKGGFTTELQSLKKFCQEELNKIKRN